MINLQINYLFQHDVKPINQFYSYKSRKGFFENFITSFRTKRKTPVLLCKKKSD